MYGEVGACGGDRGRGGGGKGGWEGGGIKGGLKQGRRGAGRRGRGSIGETPGGCCGWVGCGIGGPEETECRTTLGMGIGAYIRVHSRS